MLRSALVAAALTVAVPSAAAAADAAKDAPVAFHFYGADDCAPCVAFKRDGLPVVQASASKTGYAVAANMIRRTRDVSNPGAYGDGDPLLRRAGDKLEWLYPPIFIVTRGDEILSAKRGDWRAAMKEAEAAAEPLAVN